MFYIFIIFCIPLIIIFCAIIHGIFFGSSVDPDDNGVLRSKQAQEEFRQKKLKNIEKPYLTFKDIKLKSELKNSLEEASKEASKLYFELFDLVCNKFEEETNLKAKEYYSDIIKSKYLIDYIKTVSSDGLWIEPTSIHVYFCCFVTKTSNLKSSATYEDILNLNNKLKIHISDIKNS